MAKESCHNCVYAYWDLAQTMQSLATGFASRPACANHPESLGRMRPVSSGGVCRNYRPGPPEPAGDVKRIPLGDGLYAYVDAADYDWLSQWTWYVVNGYAARTEKRKNIYMHRQIMQPPQGKFVDHANHNKLDNSRLNLRACTLPENQRNQRKQRGSFSRYKGVGYSKDRHKWYAQLKIMGKDLWLGYHTDEITAARAYDRKAVELFREFASLNFPEEWPPQRRQELYAGRQAAGKREGKKIRRKEAKRDKRSGKRKAQAQKPKPQRRTKPAATTGNKARPVLSKPHPRTTRKPGRTRTPGRTKGR